MNLGADDYLTKPFTLVELLDAVQARLRRAEEVASRGNAAAAEQSATLRPASVPAFPASDGVVVLDPAMRALYERLLRIAPHNFPIIILGERGVGKDVLARAVHNLSPRAKAPFVALNCAALPETLLEAELFGHERGVFTGAVNARAGLFEAASGGTVFLDEIGELPAAIQAKLLRVLEDCQVRRVGARDTRRVDVRFVAATNRDIEAEAARGVFRADLLDRISGASFTVPPLRERPLEIPALARMFVARTCAEQGRPAALGITAECMQALERHAWPGNVRELKNVIQLAVALCNEDALHAEDLPQKLRDPRTPTPSDPAGALDPRVQLRKYIDDDERRRICDALERCAGNQTRAAELLGISRRTLINKMSALGIEGPRKKLRESAPIATAPGKAPEKA
jgi:DNA-binding NtrC family response regulator